MARPGGRVLIAFDDPTAPSFGPVRSLAIEAILVELRDAGVPEENVNLICANALHRKWTPEELSRILGNDLVRRFGERLRCHDAEDPDDIVHLGETSSGYSVDVHRRVVESDLTVYVNAACHLGFNGGWKSVAVGLSAWRSIRCTHTPDGMSMSCTRQPHASRFRRAGSSHREDARPPHLQVRDRSRQPRGHRQLLGWRG
jgi:nickel-dependent lactate racemase